jgi:tetratricopeptide (TPR) repeat protein
MRTSEAVRRRGVGLAGVLAGLLSLPGAVLAEEPAKADARTPAQRLLRGDDAKQAAQLQARSKELATAGKFAEALQAARELRALRERLQGADHWQAVDARLQIQTLERQAQFDPQQQADFRRALAAEREAWDLEAKQRYPQAQRSWERALALSRQLLGEEHPLTATYHNNLAYSLKAQGKYAEAEQGYRNALALDLKLRGEEHPSTATCYSNLANDLTAQSKYAAAEEPYRKAVAIFRRVRGEEHLDTARCYHNLAYNLNAQRKWAEAEEPARKAVAIKRQVLGEEHLDTAVSYYELARNLNEQGKYTEAEEPARKALALRRKLLGEEHPHTVACYDNLATILLSLGKYAEGEDISRKALAIMRQVLGEEHAKTAACYANLATVLDRQGKYAEAEQGHRKALALARQLQGEEHRNTAACYNNLATCLDHQGKYAEAEQGYRKALALFQKLVSEEHTDPSGRVTRRYSVALFQKLVSEEHTDTAAGYDNLANNLTTQGKYAEAEEDFRKALALRRQLLGEEHPDTALTYHNLAFNLQAQGKYAEAEEGYRKALALFRKRPGEEHPLTATCYHNLAGNLQAQGKVAEAEAYFGKALMICRKVLGEDHPHTALGYANLAGALAAQGRPREAEEQLAHAADTFAHVRARSAASGLERAVAGGRGPLPFLAVLLARRDQPEQAWQRFEESLGRGTWDDLQARLARSPQEQARLTELACRLERLDQVLEQYATLAPPSDDQTRQHQERLGQRRRTQEQLDALTRELALKYSLANTRAATLRQVQAILPADTALLGWVTPEGEAAKALSDHWAVLLRAKGPPAWVALPGSSTDGAWTEADRRLPEDLATALHARPQPDRIDWRPLAQRLYRQRLQPLQAHLGARADLPAVRHLVVLPSGTMDGIPLEVLTQDYTLSRAPSATLFAFLRGKARPHSSGLLALADPVFDRPDAAARQAPLPPGGLLLTAVLPGGNAARAGLRAGDVLLRYQDTPLKTSADLRTHTQAPADAKARISVTVWRADKKDPLTVEVAPGPLGVMVAPEPAPEALAKRRRIQAETVASRGDDTWKALPGTRAEVDALARRFRQARQPRTLLTDSDASEQRLAALAADGTLARVRYLHFATHGTVNWDFPLQSALILSRDRLPDPSKQLDAGLPVYTGRLTAAAVLRDWDLDAELVTLSACETGLGHYAQGEGYLGFAQALLLAGSRGVCLSLWEVDDVATALLMDRFYANLLGQREGLTQPLGKAAALAEAQTWLRTLPRAEALKRVASLTGGVERGKGRPAPPRSPAVPETRSAEEPPYAHPYFWAAFVLVGDPE